VNPFLSLQFSISSGLSDAELHEMKFLCGDRVGKARLESVRSGMDLFGILMERGLIAPDDLKYLKRLLEHLQRADLLLLVKRFEEEGELGDPAEQPDEHEKRLLKVAVDVICENIGKEWKRLMRELGMSDVKLDRIEEAHRNDLYEKIVQGLRQWQKWKGKDAKVADLIRGLRGCSLNLVADLVEN
ncbi:FADD protein, partial [Neodrepanis coruscans]|nr:FADD protein [Neodrepanis coruscans]